MSDGRIPWIWTIVAFFAGFIFAAIVVPSPDTACHAALTRAHTGTDSIAVYRESKGFCTLKADK